MGFKVSIIGGGSSSFVPLLLRRLIQSGPLGDSTVTLMDIDEHRLGVMQELGDRLVAGEGSALTVRSTLDQRESLEGADFVIAAISVGGFDAWAEDLEIPGRYGLVMHVADSVGPGGIMRAFRNAPVLAEMARNVAEVAPDAYVFNYTNPAPTEALAMRVAAPGVRSFALCSCTGHPGSAEWLAEQAGVEPGEIARPPVVAGINHCAAVTELRLRDGTDAMPLVREHATNPIVAWALETYGVLPYCWSHWVEHFPQMQRLEGEYAGTAQGVEMRYGIRTHDMGYEKARVAELEGLAATWTAAGAGAVTLADLPTGDEDWGIEVIDIIEAIVENRNQTFVVVNSAVNGYGIRPISAGPLPEPLAAHLRGYVDFQRHVVKAALSGDRDAAMHAFLLDPNIQARLELEQIGELLDEMLRANEEWLPLFRGARV